MELRTLLQHHRADVALVIGNGINRYGPASATNSWNDLILTLARRRLGSTHANVPTGISLTEFYDVLDLAKPKGSSVAGLQQTFCDLMRDWKPHRHHRRITAWAQAADAPILTTNFEKTLADAAACSLRRMGRIRFTDFYPWDSYYGVTDLPDPCAGFGIWHVNGMQHYRRSIRLGLTHYMGSVEKARGWIHKGGSARLSAGNDHRAWGGATTWLHVLFHKPLMIFGLALGETEVFLRWLLIERARYFRKFPDRRKKAWYVHTPADRGSGKLFFLDGIGIEPVEVEDFDEIYGAKTWVISASK